MKEMKRCLTAIAISTAMLGGMTSPAEAHEEVRITGGLGLYVNLWGHEVTRLLQIATGLSAAEITVACVTPVPKLPVPQARALAVLCGFVGTSSAVSILQQMKNIGTRFKPMANSCWQLRLPAISLLVMPVPVKVKGNCRA